MYRVTASIIDDREAPQRKRTDPVGRRRQGRSEAQCRTGRLQPDTRAQDYQPGDTAEILVQAPFYPARAVMTLRRSGIVKTERFTMDGPSHTLRVPISEGSHPERLCAGGSGRRGGAHGR